ncbi:cytochrome P450 [Salmonella enterica]|uniref:Cytochrome P450 n=2 Tax=Salmonella enterica I TaxID=59201 RepID=A0A3V2Y5M8_SALNE|nr:cytochrome P450 [Salmonella enterica subsp. enterica serovar Newport]EAM6499155.1 cytochrome P450 [Salmonella enterica]EBW9774962.1 cytochrome P450 [Salmonella enterica subsp. enterica serovar Bovismorbificans]ECS5597259.1 cytochrome P450 [Salmonella enterica subsp. enterica]EEH1859321.1 cytochrome P450 [Salmonella enterica subsp. houtenae serovar 50:g,z51:-]EGI5233447.1 cytochrome P450 [Salmonella enterica subsp. enterica serovar Weltevreden]
MEECSFPGQPQRGSISHLSAETTGDFPLNTSNSAWPSLATIPHYDCKPGYEVLEPASYQRAGKVKLLSGHHAWHVINYYDVKKVLTSNACLRGPSNEINGPSILPTLTPKDLLLNLDFPHHARMKRFVAKDYSSSGLGWLAPYMTGTIETLMHNISEDGMFDLFQDVLDPLAVQINCLLLGIPLEEKEYFRILSLTVQKADPQQVDNLIGKFTELYQYIFEHVTGLRQHAKDGLISRFITMRESATPPLNDEEITAILLGALLGGDQNTLTVMTKIFYALLYTNTLWKQVVKFPETTEKVVDELIRLTNLGTASAFPRICSEAIELSGVTIPEGDTIYPDVLLANRDPSVYPSPLTINPFRHGPRHLQFGYGMHHCMGQELAKLEIYTAVKTIARLVPDLRLSENLPPENFIWNEGIILRRPAQLPVFTPHKLSLFRTKVK